MGERTNRADSSTARSSARSCSTALDSAVVEGTTSPGFASLHCLYAPEIGNCSDNRHLTVSSQLVTEVTGRFTPPSGPPPSALGCVEILLSQVVTTKAGCLPPGPDVTRSGSGGVAVVAFSSSAFSVKREMDAKSQSACQPSQPGRQEGIAGRRICENSCGA